jgi:hypothetical protein
VLNLKCCEVDGWILQWNGNTSEVLEDIKGSETKKSSSESSVHL